MRKFNVLAGLLTHLVEKEKPAKVEEEEEKGEEVAKEAATKADPEEVVGDKEEEETVLTDRFGRKIK